MNRIRNGIIYMLVAMMAVGLFFGCSSSEKPSEETMKNIIVQFVDISDKSDLRFDEFRITNSFFSKHAGSSGESTPYNIEVDYTISYIPKKEFLNVKNKILLLYDSINNYKIYLETPFNNDQDRRDEIKKDIIRKTKEIDELQKYNFFRREIVKDNVRFSFSKKGDKWYGKMRWE